MLSDFPFSKMYDAVFFLMFIGILAESCVMHALFLLTHFLYGRVTNKRMLRFWRIASNSFCIILEKLAIFNQIVANFYISTNNFVILQIKRALTHTKILVCICCFHT